ncbi:hypothetical protein CRG98_011152 [Punica granatum]|uniref:Uncharacterized protein n=1 Tax=Punica granatum TaxID=22663 RepID=A0A2I0KJT0_PUNGR|nr:hypothetical protein CRG98_011152 [Punica granatum]
MAIFGSFESVLRAHRQFDVHLNHEPRTHDQCTTNRDPNFILTLPLSPWDPWSTLGSHKLPKPPLPFCFLHILPKILKCSLLYSNFPSVRTRMWTLVGARIARFRIARLGRNVHLPTGARVGHA